MIHCDAWNDSAGRSAVCLRFKCTMCKKESCASGMFFFAASDLGGATPCQFDVGNMMVWTRELRWNRAIVGICVTCLGCNSRTGLFWDLLPCYFGKVIRQMQDPGTWLQNVNKRSYGCFLKWWYHQNTSKWSFLVGKPMVVGYHHFGKPHIQFDNFNNHGGWQ